MMTLCTGDPKSLQCFLNVKIQDSLLLIMQVSPSLLKKMMMILKFLFSIACVAGEDKWTGLGLEVLGFKDWDDVNH